MTLLSNVPEDYADIGFDVTPHIKAIKALTEYGSDVKTIRAALIARDIIYIRVPGARFRITASADMAYVPDSGRIAFEEIFQSKNSDEVCQVRADVEWYFLRHFPGRYLKPEMDASDAAAGNGEFVYIEVFAPEEE